ncbi:tumor susceptibility gene 101 protein-like [Artemia franciscana]|uniref:Tumor susceptibility gene 101 protein n=1 Tax=Artemia franciscana TaxID=6661 RepID=A0AA88IR37_ARTSF|nr:hypothetical protein QYM36_000603 [Artemia franciscana]
MDGKIVGYINKNYKNAEATKRAVKSVLSTYKNLAPKISSYVFTNGVQKELLCLDGTVPVVYKYNTYNIPVNIWLLETHPLNAPMVYVTPTPDMTIKVSKHVDQNGLVYLPYLHNWSPAKSDLPELIAVMIGVFGEQPPVYSKPKTEGYPSQQPFYFNSGMAMPSPGAYGQPSEGFVPPYPTQSSSMPPYPVAATSLPYPTNSQCFPNGMPEQSSTGTIQPEHIRASLLSAVEDKIRRKLGEMSAAALAEMESLRRTGQELSQGKQTLENIFTRIEMEQADINRNIGLLTEKESELEKLVSSHGDDGGCIDVDNAVVTTAPLYQQLLNACAEDAATEDAIYYLGEALRRDVIDIEVFLKHVRSLSRKQFLLRALMEKCRQKAGLAV